MSIDQGLITEILRKSRALLENGWCQGSFAKTEDGITCSSLSKDACSWCSLGAVENAINDIEGDINYPLMDEVTNRLHATLPDWESVVSFNDNPQRRQEEVLALFDAAIRGEKYAV